MRALAIAVSAALLACATPPSEIHVEGELTLGNRYLERCDTGELYALLFPSSVAFRYQQLIDRVDPNSNRILVAELLGELLAAPSTSSADATLAVYHVAEIREGSCPRQPPN